MNAIPATGHLREGDLLVLMYDGCLDPDDGLAAVATKAVVASLGVPSPWVVGGACGTNSERSSQGDGTALMDAIWGGSWLDANADRAGAVSASADAWAATLANGRDVWVAENGPSDVTATILREMADRYPSLELGGVHVVQNSSWNEELTVSENLDLVRWTTDYRRIGDGARTDEDADPEGWGGDGFRIAASRLVDLTANGPFPDAWRAAFDRLPPGCSNPDSRCELDLGDAGKPLYILGDEGTRDVDDFAERYLR